MLDPRVLGGKSGCGRHHGSWRSFAPWLIIAFAFWEIARATAIAEDVSPPPILQWFEVSYDTMVRRTPDLFLAGYGAVWVPPPGRADTGDHSAGYDAYDRFDLGTPSRRTLYGTQDGLRAVARQFHRAGVDLHVDFIINHDGYHDRTSKDGSVSFVEAGDYPGFVVSLPGVDADGDFHPADASGEKNGRINEGLIDIDHRKNHRLIRHPVPGFANNIPPGKKFAFSRQADVPNPENRRFYPDRNLPPILLFDPRTGEQGIKVFPFNLTEPLAGDPVEENAMGLLMRNAQWLVQVIGVDGFRIDAAKHVDGFVLDLFDRAVYRSHPRKNLDGSTKHVFSYCETLGVDPAEIATFVRKTIDPADPGKIGANRDALDFDLFFRLGENLSGNGLANDWRVINSRSVDVVDDGRHNGSAGVKFAASHDAFGAFLSNVANAYTLMTPGNAVVYHNGHEFDPGRDFPKDGRGDALGGLYGKRITRLVEARNTHGRGNYRECWLDKELLAFERQGSAVVLLSNRSDRGFDARTLKVSFAPGTPLIELTGNASDPAIDPHDEIPELVVVNADETINVRFPRNTNRDGKFHGSGYLIYGLAAPQASAGLELIGVDHVEPSETPTNATNGTARLADLHVIKGDSFQVKLQTREVKLLGSVRDPAADGDNALIRVDDGKEINGNGSVDFRTPGTVTYGFESFVNKRSPRVGPNGLSASGGGDGEFVQTIDATKLENGVHFLEVRVFRHRTDGGPPVYSQFKKVIKVDRD